MTAVDHNPPSRDQDVLDASLTGRCIYIIPTQQPLEVEMISKVDYLIKYIFKKKGASHHLCSHTNNWQRQDSNLSLIQKPSFSGQDPAPCRGAGRGSWKDREGDDELG